MNTLTRQLEASLEQDKPDNLRIWDSLGKTDPAHTKQFQRSGGFKGTAIKPMWCNLRMTEMFGPCGIGWGSDKPEYQVVPVEDEILVFCTVRLWYIEDGVTGHVFGQGGDKLLTQILAKDGQGNKIRDEATGKFKTYPQSDDEAFKKAYTDALSNAMKFIGVAADVHMGLFDDNKYVAEMKAEFGVARQETTRAKSSVNTEAEDPDDIDAFLNREPVYDFTEPPVPPAPKLVRREGRVITPKMAGRFMAIAVSNGKTKAVISHHLASKGYGAAEDILSSEYDSLCDWAGAK